MTCDNRRVQWRVVIHPRNWQISSARLIRVRLMHEPKWLRSGIRTACLHSCAYWSYLNCSAQPVLCILLFVHVYRTKTIVSYIEPFIGWGKYSLLNAYRGTMPLASFDRKKSNSGLQLRTLFIKLPSPQTFEDTTLSLIFPQITKHHIQCGCRSTAKTCN